MVIRATFKTIKTHASQSDGDVLSVYRPYLSHDDVTALTQSGAIRLVSLKVCECCGSQFKQELGELPFCGLCKKNTEMINVYLGNRAYSTARQHNGTSFVNGSSRGNREGVGNAGAVHDLQAAADLLRKKWGLGDNGVRGTRDGSKLSRGSKNVARAEESSQLTVRMQRVDSEYSPVRTLSPMGQTRSTRPGLVKGKVLEFRQDIDLQEATEQCLSRTAYPSRLMCELAVESAGSSHAKKWEAYRCDVRIPGDTCRCDKHWHQRRKVRATKESQRRKMVK